MFENDRQLGDVCFILCAWIPSSPWKWADDGYRRDFFEVPPGISSGEAAMIRFAAALWGGDDLPVWRGFDNRRMRDIGELLLAMHDSPLAIDAWIAKRGGHGSPDKIVRATREKRIREMARGA